MSIDRKCYFLGAGGWATPPHNLCYQAHCSIDQRRVQCRPILAQYKEVESKTVENSIDIE